MMITTIGHISLTISSTIYLIWFIPQILLNFKRKDTEGLSMLMHGILCIAYLTDLMYGFGLAMQWQYRMVTIAGLCSLTLQHYQFGRYGLHRASEKISYYILSLIALALFCYAIYVIGFSAHVQNFYDHIGMFTNICWLGYMLPQIIKNYNNKSVVGLSPYFVGIAIFLNICDATSAWALDWDYPSKVGPCISFIGNCTLLSQVFYYGKRQQQFLRLAVNR